MNGIREGEEILFNFFSLSVILIIASSFMTFLSSDELRKKLQTSLFFVAMGFLSSLALSVLSQNTVKTYELILKQPFNTVDFVFDPLSSIFIIVISVISFLGLLYTFGYLNHYKDKKRNKLHVFILHYFILSMLLVVTTQNALFFLLVWEMMSLSSFLLLNFESEKKEVMSAGIVYFIWMHVCVLFLIFAFAMASIHSHNSFSFNDFKTLMANDPASKTVLWLFFIGFAIKAGFFPFHSWLIKAHPAAPANVSGLMSGVMLKVAIYAILRMINIFPPQTLNFALTVLFVSLISALWGIIYSLIQKDIKKSLAYSSVENIGIIGIGIGIGLLGQFKSNSLVMFLGYSGALFHVINHSIYKTMLFFSSGNIYQFTHEKNINLLGGLIKPLFLTAPPALIACLAISALPPFSGFISELLIYVALFKGIISSTPEFSLIFISSIIVLSIVGVIALVSFTRFFSFIFLGNPRTNYSKKEKMDLLNIPLYAYATLLLLISFFPAFVLRFILKAVTSLTVVTEFQGLTEIINLLEKMSFYSIIFVLITLALFLLKKLLTIKQRIVYTKTWDCGFQAGTHKMQYNGSSYSSSFYELIQPLIRKKVNQDVLKEVFPEKINSKSLYHDIFETSFNKYVNPFLQKMLTLFTNFQSGNTQNYLLYGIIFLVIVFLYVTFIG